MALWPHGGKQDIHQRLGVPQLPGDQMILTFPWVRLPTALKTPRKTGVHSKRVRPAEPAASQPRKSAFQLDRAWPWSRNLFPKPNVQWFSEAYSWLRYVPNRLRQRVLPTLAQPAFNPGPILVLLYAGNDDSLSLDSCLHAHYPRLSPHVVAFDTRRSPQPLGHDLLEDQPYGKLCQAAIEGRLSLSFVGFRSLTHQCLCVVEQKTWCGDFPLLQPRSRRWMVRACSSSARCFWQHWWSRIALCRFPETQWSSSHQDVQGLVSHGGA